MHLSDSAKPMATLSVKLRLQCKAVALLAQRVCDGFARFVSKVHTRTAFPRQPNVNDSVSIAALQYAASS